MATRPTNRQRQKVRSREKILAAASRRLRLGGPENVGIQAVTADAGLTHGGFYAHFRNKEDLLNAAFDHAMDSGQSGWFASAEQADSFDARLARLAASYLSPQHRDDRAGGCAIAALASELESAPASLKKRYADAVEHTVRKIAQQQADKLDAAIEFLATLTGAINIARNIEDPDLSDRVLQAAAARFVAAD